MKEILIGTISGTVAALPAYPIVPTTVSSFTNDVGYITGITSSDANDVCLLPEESNGDIRTSL